MFRVLKGGEKLNCQRFLDFLNFVFLIILILGYLCIPYYTKFSSNKKKMEISIFVLHLLYEISFRILEFAKKLKII